MTNREKEIFELIRINPKISQNEIAGKLNIKRSSVSVHISNLMAKGYILGRNYIIKEASHILVIGASNLDVQGAVVNDIIPKDSNIGKIDICFGGVGRNIVDNLSRLINDIRFISVFGDDPYSYHLMKKLSDNNVDISESIFLKNSTLSMYIAILDKYNDMEVAVADMDNISHIDYDFIVSKSSIIENSSILVMDTNLEEESLKYITDIVNDNNTKIVVDLVSTTKAKKIKGILDKVYALKANKLELEVIVGKKINTDEDVVKATDILLSKGVKNIFITLGARGVYYKNDKTSGFIKTMKTNVVNATGAGDSFVAGIVYGLSKEYSIKDITLYAISMSYLTIQSKENVNANLNEEILKENYLEIKKYNKEKR